MNQRPGAEHEREVLSEQLATRVLTRASELDAALKAGASVAELRRAALEAGISAEAFEAALAEVQHTGTQVPDVNALPRSRQRRRILAAVIAITIAVAAIGLSRSRGPDVAAVPMVEEAFTLRCLAPDRAAALVRPLMGLPQNTVVVSPGTAPGVLTVRGTPAQMQDVRALLKRYEGTESAACAPGPAPPL